MSAPSPTTPAPHASIPLDAVLQGYTDPSMSIRDLAAAHRLSLLELTEILNSDAFLSLLAAVELVNERRQIHLHATAAMSALSDITNANHSALERRRAACAILRFISRPIRAATTQPPRAGAARDPSPLSQSTAPSPGTVDRPAAPTIARAPHNSTDSAQRTAPPPIRAQPAAHQPIQKTTAQNSKPIPAPLTHSSLSPHTPSSLPSSSAPSALLREPASRRSAAHLASLAGAAPSGWP